MIRTGTLRAIACAAIFSGATLAHSQEAAPPVSDPQTIADTIAREVEDIRGLAFKEPVKAQNQSPEEFRDYISREMNEALPESLRRHYDPIVRALGLYRGPVIEDFSTMMTAVVSSQTGAYYDPETKGFFVLMQGMPEVMQGVLYSHELYHAMQDQYFDLTRFIEGPGKPGDPNFNSDRHLARGAVVEGEATYLMSLWMVKKMTGSMPARDMMGAVVAAQSNLGMDQLREMLKQPAFASAMGTDIQNAIEAAENIPMFVMETMMGVYMKGLSFVYAVHEQGWQAVETLYGDYPPESTEQILHPEKWLAREAPVTFDRPKFEKVKALRGWELLDTDVLGEFQWRIVFMEHGLQTEAESAAAGWGGDRYAVFTKQDSDATLLLLRTAWDSGAEATEFVNAYRKVQETKRADREKPMRLEQKGRDVYIVEGGDETTADALLKFLRTMKPRAPSKKG